MFLLVAFVLTPRFVHTLFSLFRCQRKIFFRRAAAVRRFGGHVDTPAFDAAENVKSTTADFDDTFLADGILRTGTDGADT